MQAIASGASCVNVWGDMALVNRHGSLDGDVTAIPISAAADGGAGSRWRSALPTRGLRRDS